MKDRFDIEDRIIVTQRVVTVMIAEWSFRSALVRWRVSDESEFRFCCESMSFRAERVTRHLQFLSGEQRSKHKLGHVFRQRCNRGESERRRSTKKYRHGQRLIETLSFGVVKASAFLNLPMQARGVRVVNLDPIDAEIMFFSGRM